jgi:hypothetical protein
MYASKDEKFPAADLYGLREELLQSGLDSWQAGDLIACFIAGRGYGVSRVSARNAAFLIGADGCSIERIQEEFEKLALVM